MTTKYPLFHLRFSSRPSSASFSFLCPPLTACPFLGGRGASRSARAPCLGRASAFPPVPGSPSAESARRARARGQKGRRRRRRCSADRPGRRPTRGPDRASRGACAEGEGRQEGRPRRERGGGRRCEGRPRRERRGKGGERTRPMRRTEDASRRRRTTRKGKATLRWRARRHRRTGRRRCRRCRIRCRRRPPPLRPRPAKGEWMGGRWAEGKGETWKAESAAGGRAEGQGRSERKRREVRRPRGRRESSRLVAWALRREQGTPAGGRVSTRPLRCRSRLVPSLDPCRPPSASPPRRSRPSSGRRRPWS